VYRNDEKRPIEALYCFPVDEGAAVCGFRIETGERVLTVSVGSLKPGQEAAAASQSARRGKSTGVAGRGARGV